jgi:DNA-binding GntR family transcriptional regulator
VRTALNRLALKGLVVRADRGAYEIARTATESEAA